MNFDIIEAVRQRQQKEQRGISIENGKVVIRPGILNDEVPQELPPEEETAP